MRGEELNRVILPELPAPGGAFVHAVVHGGLVYCSGQAGVHPVTGTVPPGIGPQTHQALRNLAAVLAEAGSSLERVLKATVYIRDASMFAHMDAVFADVFGEAFPARTIVPGIGFRAGVDVEIDVVAVAG